MGSPRSALLRSVVTLVAETEFDDERKILEAISSCQESLRKCSEIGTATVIALEGSATCTRRFRDVLRTTANLACLPRPTLAAAPIKSLSRARVCARKKAVLSSFRIGFSGEGEQQQREYRHTSARG